MTSRPPNEPPRPSTTPSAPRPARLVVVGAAGGIGKWLGDHVLSTLEWDHVTLLDTADAIVTTDHRYRPDTVRARVAGIDTADLGAAGTAVCIAVPPAMLAEVSAWLLPRLSPDAVVFDLSHDRVAADAALAAVRPELRRFGIHALFGLTAESAEGMTFAFCPSTDESAHSWLASAIEAVGGTVNIVEPARHDEIMGYVQAAAHQALLGFADVIGRAPFDLEQDLWANRTPVFELLLALSSRALAPGQEGTTASIQLAPAHRAIAVEIREANERLHDAIEHARSAQSDVPLVDHLAGIRAPYPSSLFSRIQQAGSLATSAVQSTRARIGAHRRAGELVGVRSVDSTDRLHVGTVEHVTATSLALRNVLVGTRGKAALLSDDQARANAKRLGIGGSPRNVEFSLGKVRILSPLELERELDHWLASISMGCKFLIPESISGASAVRVIEGVPHVLSATLISEEVRLGQRECVVRFHARIDRSLDDLERAIQHRIDEVFVWPDGVVLPADLRTRASEPGASEPGAHADVRLGYLGPAGTFSDTAARQLARLLQAPDAVRVELPDFIAVVDAVVHGDVVLGVVPITNSSSGLVDLAAEVLFSAPRSVCAGGVVDVPVRFDAYVARGADLAHGMPVYSHPQGLRQCSAFIAAHNLVEVPCTSTGDACRRVAAGENGVALAATGMERDFDVTVARTSVGNLAGALTRFLVIGADGVFGKPPRDDHTARSVWVVSPGAGLDTDGGSARYDEILRGPSGHCLVVSTSPERLTERAGVRFMGTIPWSPRTPLVMV